MFILELFSGQKEVTMYYVLLENVLREILFWVVFIHFLSLVTHFLLQPATISRPKLLDIDRLCSIFVYHDIISYIIRWVSSLGRHWIYKRHHPGSHLKFFTLYWFWGALYSSSTTSLFHLPFNLKHSLGYL